MLWLRGLLFTLLVPTVVGYLIPASLPHPPPGESLAAHGGWILIAAGAAIYLHCLLRFLAAGGTPAIYFTRALRHVIGEEPDALVSGGLYRFSRNPMYVAVVTAVFGQAVLYQSKAIAIYGFVVFVCFHIAVVWVEEPHLRAVRGTEYADYCRRVPRWIGLPR